MESEFDRFTDEELVTMWDNEDAKNALYARILPYLKKIVAQFGTSRFSFLDKVDVEQEAALAFAMAVKSYDPGKNAGFRTYLWICVRTRLLNLLKHYTAQSIKAMDDAISIYAIVDDNDTMLIDVIPDDSQSPEEAAIFEQTAENIRKTAKEILSKFEYSVLCLYMDGKAADEIADILGKSIKSVRNTLQRAKTKLKIAFNK